MGKLTEFLGVGFKMEKHLISGNSEELIGKLREKYGLGKSQVYKRLQFLEIKMQKAEGEVFLDSHQLELLDALHSHISSGNSLESFSSPGALVQSSATEIEQAALNVEPIEEGQQIRQLVRTAQEKAAGVLMAQNLLAAQFKDNPEMLDEDLFAQVRATEEAIAPKSQDPMKYAHNLIGKYQMTQTAA